MKRRLLNLLTLLSLLLCVAVVALWVRSWFATDQVLYGQTHPSPSGLGTEDRYCYVLSARGSVLLLRERVGGYDLRTGWTYASDRPGKPEEFVNLPPGVLGFRVSRWQPGGYFAVSFPLWPLVLLLAMLPFSWAYRRVRRSNRPGHCRSCGYDLRATPGRCPECGTIPSVPPAG